MDEYLINNLISPSNIHSSSNGCEMFAELLHNPEEESYISLSLSPTENDISGKKPSSSTFSGAGKRISSNTMKFGNHTSRNKNDRDCNPSTIDYNLMQCRFLSSEDNDSVVSKDIFNFSPSDVRKVSPIAREECSPCDNYASPNGEYSNPSEQLTPQELEEYYYLKQKQAELDQRIKEIEQKRLKSDKISSNKKDRRLYEISNEYEAAEKQKSKEYYLSVKPNDFQNESTQTAVGLHGITMPSTTKILKNSSENKEDVSHSGDNFNFLNRYVGISNYGKDIESKTPLVGKKLFDDNFNNNKGENSRNESHEHNKSKRGILYEINNDNMYIGSLNISDAEQNKANTEVKQYKFLIDNYINNMMNIDVKNNIDGKNLCEVPSLFQINENDLENLESSTERIDNIKSSFNDNTIENNQYLGNSKGTTSGNYDPHEELSQRSTLKQIDFDSARNQIAEEKQNTTITKFVANIDLNYQTNLDSLAKRRKRRQDEIYEDDYDECKKNIDFIDSSHIKETPNISNASNFKTYGDCELIKNNGKQFTRFVQSDSDQNISQVPVKEVCIDEYYNAHNERINYLKELREPVSHDEVQVILEYEIVNDSNLEVSAIELKPSVKLDNSEEQEDNDSSEMSSDIRNDSMFELFNKSSSNNTNKCLERPISNLELNPHQKYNEAMIEIDNFGTFNDIKVHKTTFINDPKHALENTRNKAKYELASNFNSHTIQCDDRKSVKNNKYEMRKRSLSKNKSSAESKK